MLFNYRRPPCKFGRFWFDPDDLAGSRTERFGCSGEGSDVPWLGLNRITAQLVNKHAVAVTVHFSVSEEPYISCHLSQYQPATNAQLMLLRSVFILVSQGLARQTRAEQLRKRYRQSGLSSFWDNLKYVAGFDSLAR